MLSFFPRDVLAEIWDLAESVSEGFPTDTWGQLVLLTTTLHHKTCINTSRQVLEKTLLAINAIFTQDNTIFQKLK